jgi:colanic acid/amylovoran biosynthesis protein
MMRTISLHSFHSLDNYGSAMMGLVTIDRLRRQMGGRLRVESDFLPDTDLAEVRSELGAAPDELELLRAPDRQTPWPRGRGSRLLRAVDRLLIADVRGYDMVIFLGGDDLSEYYNKAIWQQILDLGPWGRHAPLVLLGQTIGPFERRQNRLAARLVFAHAHIFPRDRWCTDYLKSDLGLNRQVEQSSDLAFADLPRQNEPALAAQTLAEHGLEPGRYVTLVVSAIQQAGYYTKDRAAYLDGWKRIAERLLADPRLDGHRLVLLAHTHGQHYGDEPAYIDALLPRIDPAISDRIVPIRERVLPTRARLVLGQGLFTITARMHPAVSTFQMGKPAIALSYSKKYEGVIGTMLGRSDLIVEAGDAALWDTGAIVERTMAKVDHVLNDHPRLCIEIRAAIDAQKAILDRTFTRLGALLGRPAGQ